MSGPIIKEFRNKCLLLSFDLTSSGWINNYLITESEVVTGKSQTEALPYWPGDREFKKLRRQLQRKRHIKIELCVKWSIFRLFYVGHIVQNRRSALSLAWHEWFSCKGKEWKNWFRLRPRAVVRKFHVVVWQTTSKHCTKKRAARAGRLFSFIQPIKSLIFGVVIDVAVVKS